MTDQAEFGSRLRRLRTARGLAQRDLAGGLVTSSYISLLESGRRVPTATVLDHLAEVLGVTVRELTDPLRRIAEFVDEPAATGAEAESRPEEMLLGLLDAGGLHAAPAALARAYEAARTTDCVRAVEIGIWLTRVLSVLDEHRQRVETLKELSGCPGCGFGPNLRAYLDAELTDALRVLGRLAEARDVATAARSRLVGAQHQPVRKVRVLAELVMVLADLGENHTAGDALVQLHEALASADPDSVPDGRAHWLAARACACLGRFGEARRHLAVAHANLTVPVMPLAEWVAFCRFSASVLLDASAPANEVLDWLRAAESGTAALGSPVAQARVQIVRARYELAAGRPETALAHLTAVPPPAEADLGALGTAEARLVRGRVLAAVGRTADAVAELRAVIGLCEELGAYRLATLAWHTLHDTWRPSTSDDISDQPWRTR